MIQSYASDFYTKNIRWMEASQVRESDRVPSVVHYEIICPPIFYGKVVKFQEKNCVFGIFWCRAASGVSGIEMLVQSSASLSAQLENESKLTVSIILGEEIS